MLTNSSSQKKNRILPFACICFILQAALAPDIVLASGQINFALIFTVICALSKRDNTTIVYAFIAGLLFDLLSTGPVGIMACLLSIVAYLVVDKIHVNLFEDIATSSIIFSVLALMVCLLHFLIMLVCGSVTSFIPSLIYRVLPVFILTSCAFIPLAFLYRRLTGAISMHSRNASMRPTRSHKLHL
ncbi:rod shape-determining protein MreD [Fannyhessea vaginae]|uniref:rod shape-determining protein MreD n=1 Tax=Fannyhessea vaginae TaxID=82135 RepID=UPI0023F49C8A|nr:rod shape-determining protein MreD [Fannyhessea vaginae]